MNAVAPLAAIAGSKGGQAKQSSPTIASNSTPSLATARIVYLWSWGPIVGPVDGLRSVKLDGTPLVAEDGTQNYPSVKWQFRNGDLNQARLDGIAESSNEINVNQTLLTTAPWLYSITNPVLDAVRVRFGWPNLQAQDQSGNINGVRIDYAIDVATDGGPFVEVLAAYVDRKNVTTYERSHRIDLPAGSRWTIRARRLTKEANSSLISDTMTVKAVAEVVDSDQEYPLTAVGCIEYDAQQFGGDIAKIAVRMRGRIVRVPTNYNPETRTYASSGAGTTGGVWDGTFKEAYTNNPAWVFYDLVLDPYYGLGDRIDATMIDRWNLYRIGQYCDQMVPNGKGGLEPRYTLNIYLQKQADAYAVLQDFAQSFHGMSTWDGSQITVNADMPGDPVYTYNPSQILNYGEISYAGTRARDRHNVAMVTWDNPDQGFETDKEPVFDDEALAETGSVSELSVAAYGCTSLGQAQRAGQWALLTEQTQTRGANFRVGLDGQIPKPGQVISLADPMLAGRANGGRISAVAGKVVTLDREVAIPTTAKLRVNLPSGKSEARVIRSFAGRAVTLAAEFSETLAPEAGWVLEYDDLKSMQFLVRNITRPEWHQFQFEVIQHEPSKFDTIDYGAVIDDRPISALPIGIQEAPAQVLLSQHVVVEQGIAVTVMTIGWSAAPGAVAYDVEWRWGSREWIKVPRTGELSVDVRGIYSGEYIARVRAVSALEVSSLPTSSVVTTLQGKTGTPPAVVNFAAASQVFGIKLSWAFPEGAEDTQRTELWYSSTNSREDATKLSDLAFPQAEYVLQGLAAGVTFYFWARLVDKTGNVGDWAPAGAGLVGQSGSDAAPILDYLAGQIGETELGKELSDKLEGLQDQIDAFDSLSAYNPDKAYAKSEIVIDGGRIYQAAQAVPASTPPPNATYWRDVGEVLETANGLAQQVERNSTDIQELDGQVTATASQLRGLQAAYRDDDGTGDMDDAVQGWQSQAKITEESKTRATADEALAQRMVQLEAEVGEDLNARITDIQETIATNESATARHLEQLEARAGDNEALIQQVSQVQATTDGKLSLMWSMKFQVNSAGQYVYAGIGAGIENGPGGLQSTLLFTANQIAFANPTTAGAVDYPFIIKDGQNILGQAFIGDGTITSAKIGDYIQSTNYVAGATGWRLAKDGTFEINATVSGQGRMVMTNRALKVYDANNVLRVQLGDLTA